ncbi:CRISPR-associated endoribonuclease Cas2 [Nitrospira tepida]|uniref:CRISPR-associated endoribonuclease Cas2 n=1 Tax=Nitrospira tepida TaxID=2973512 RepID=A0AA86MZH1_9BACT|nr:hypothetical protein [Nitrospira tepida]CAI4031899.1 CRISPR-associated endoribonuclease Cas2 [Nitrospira tepida]
MANLYLIAYDLRKPGQNYQNLWDALGRLRAKKALESTWIVRSESDAPTIREYLRRYIDQNDGLLVTGMNGWASFNTITQIAQA